ncbi:MAG: ATP-binding cassette domain-containing protein [Actinobacteria bacterium]|nr:MAG: ATP-binding cassette domain-containing protein [Actinomycetota bacterium]
MHPARRVARRARAHRCALAPPRRPALLRNRAASERVYARPVPAALAVRGLAKRYGAIEALGGVDLDVAEGELVGLLGPNGAGKSTLVKIACGLVRASAGDAEVWGARAGTRPARRALGTSPSYSGFRAG